MKANKAYRFRIYPNAEQQIMIAKTFGCVRFVYNRMLEDKIAFPVALFAELLWDPSADTGSLIEQISKFPSVSFSNL